MPDSRAEVCAVPVPTFLVLATTPDFRAIREVRTEIGLLAFGMTACVENCAGRWSIKSVKLI